MGRVTVTVEIGAPIERVWRALTVPDEVRQWDGVEPLDVAADYPQPGRHARWRTRFAGVPITLHDRVEAVEAPTRFASTIDVAFVHVEEEYRLTARADGGTSLVSDNRVTSGALGMNGMAVRLTRSNVRASMERLRRHCES
jgi:uncharacterized protein YndB with AHSA1/START domain